MSGGDKTICEGEKELRGWLVVLNGDLKDRDYRLFAGKTVVGSNYSADIYLPDRRLEPYHFSIRIECGSVRITDLDSDSGLFLDGRRIYKEKIEDETKFKASDIEFLIKML